MDGIKPPKGEIMEYGTAKTPLKSRAVMGSLLLGVALCLLPAAVMADGDRAFTVAPDSPDLEWGDCPAFMPAGCGLAVIQGDPAEPNADVFFRLPAGTTAPNHWHTSAERMILVAGEMEVDYEGQDPVVLESGTYAYGPAELEHVTTCTSETDCMLFIAFEEPVDAHAVEAD